MLLVHLWRRPIATLLVSGLAGIACAQAESAEPLRTDVIRARDIAISARAAGVVAPVTTIEVKSQASGEITAVHVTEGESVRRGQLLVRVDRASRRMP